MKIEAVKASLPSRKVSNEDVIGLIRTHSQDVFDGDLDETLQRVKFYLDYSGAKYRNWLGPDETPLQLLCTAVDNAIAESGLAKSDIDVLIYTGIGRGFIEPAGAYHVASALGMSAVQCFDLIDACMSWTRAVQLCHSLFATGAFKNALIVNAEFNMREGGYVYPNVYKLKNAEAIESTFPAFTLGESATATVLSATPGEWEFEFASRPDLSDLCNVPLHGFEGYCTPSTRIARNGVGRFTSFGFEMQRLAVDGALQVFNSLKVNRDDIRAVFTHASSKRDWDNAADKLGIRERLNHIYPETGNVVSASVPTSMALAIDRGRVKRGDRLALWVVSAGMVMAASSFVY